MTTDKLTYSEAEKRLTEIVAKLEDQQQDIDTIGDLLKEGKELLTFCKEKLYKVENDIKKILEEQN